MKTKQREPKEIRVKRLSFVKKFSLSLGILLTLAISLLWLISWYSDAIYIGSNSNEAVTIVLKEGDTLLSRAEEFENLGIIKSVDALKIYLRLNEISPNIKAGSYLIPLNINIPKLIQTLETGTFKPAIVITIREGLWDSVMAEEIDKGFRTAGEEREFLKEEFLAIAKNPDRYDFSNDVQSFLESVKKEGAPLTGFLFPDTYHFNADSTATEVIETMIINFKRKLVAENIEISDFERTQYQFKDFYEVLTLASVLEKEAGRDDLTGIVSGVFHNRLKQNYPLQSDATVNFATGKNVRGASFEDLKVDSPYNTYMYPGLMPTPINNPGIRSIKAAMSPVPTDYFFFWHSSENKIYYAVTYEEHQRNIVTYP